MKKIVGLIFASLFILGGLVIDSSAQTSRQTINARQNRQQRRIYRGVRSGRLTGREAVRLERRQMAIRRTEARYRRSGGGLSMSERRRLQRRLNRTNRSIYRQKHDKQYYRNRRRSM